MLFTTFTILFIGYFFLSSNKENEILQSKKQVSFQIQFLLISTNEREIFHYLFVSAYLGKNGLKFTYWKFDMKFRMD